MIETMRNVTLTVRVRNLDADETYCAIRDFEDYPNHVDDVRSVVVRPGATAECAVSDWEVYFRNGPLRWVEIDYFRPEQRSIVFEQESGDFHVFRGNWTVAELDHGTTVTFRADFDFGIPSLAGVLEPIAEKVLKEGIATILAGILGGIEVVGDPATAAAVDRKLASAAVSGTGC